ncbi:MAG: diguanylate cyclase [Helicobacteraceae bacterium]|nr:diguanylate cyclase [Helicobacteraceae bacterium]
MNSKKQIIVLGAIFITIFTILFLNIRNEYSNEYKAKVLEINGINKITHISELDLLLKSVRGLTQLNKVDAEVLKKRLFINDDEILEKIEQLNCKQITDLYNSINKNKNNLSKMQLLTEYTELLKLINNKRIDIAASTNLVLESDKDTYFLIMITILEIPKTIENIGKIRAFGIGLLDKHNNNNNKLTFSLDMNIKLFIDKVEEIKYTIKQLHLSDRNKLKSLLDLIVSDFYNIQIIVSDVEKNESQLSAKEYFLEISKLVNKIDALFDTSINILNFKLEKRKLELENLLLIGSTLYILLMFIILLSLYYNYQKFDRDSKLKLYKNKQKNFLRKLEKDYLDDSSLKNISNKSLTNLISYFNALNGTVYLYDHKNKKLYLAATYGIEYDSLEHTLSMHKNLISENILEKSIKIIDIDEMINIGNIKINATKLVTIPIHEFENSIGTIQLIFDKNFAKIDLDFLESVVSFMGTYIYKALKEEEANKYLKLIDKNVLLSKTDLDGNITEISKQLCELSQYTKEEILGNTHRIFRHTDMESEVFEYLWEKILEGKNWNGNLKDRKKDGTYYWVDTHIAPDLDINGNIIGFTAIRTDITDKKKLEEIAITDGLTALYNRRHFDNIFANQVEINRRDKKLLAFILIDIDNFKQYNDTYGHQDGDITLKLVADSLKNTLKRTDDYTFRLGGEEFGLLYHIENFDDAYLIANQARENIEALKILHSKNSASKFVTISGGLYILKSSDNSTIQEIYKKADQALYKAKNSGRNQISVTYDTF